MKVAERKYQKRVKNYSELLEKQKKAERIISNLRLMVFIIGACAAIFAYITGSYINLAATFVVFTGLFIYLVIIHRKLIERMKYTALLLDINNSSIKRLSGQWNTFSDDGQDFVDDSHGYTSDLDVFGYNSIFQWINAANTFVGRQVLRDLLAGGTGSSNDIRERQEAVEELAAMLNWRQRFSAEGMMTAKQIHDPKELIAWGKERKELFSKKWVIAICRICPVITITLVIASFLTEVIPWYFPSTALLIQFAMVFYKIRERHRIFSIIESYNADLRVYYKMLKLFEMQSFKSTLINNIKKTLKSKSDIEAFGQIDRLSAIVDSLSNRRNAFYIIFNTLMLWDFQQIIALERWKLESGMYLKAWLDALGKMEALSSLSVIRFENLNWAMPLIDEGTQTVLESKSLGHPLIIGKRVHNDLAFDENVKVILITGSNMSGKSTLLRTIGVNLVLAYAGAPVCAEIFKTSIMEIFTCMRIKDNLEERTSSFYAELLRIKRIVYEAESGKRIFFLLDEIFKGTNSQDRHIGARVLINKLSHTNSLGLVSTHDLELCDLEQNNGKIANYHFQEYYEDGKINFDYKLRLGPSTTRNALHLMRLAGIEVDENTVL